MAAARTLRLILGDQLNHHHAWFKQIDDRVIYVGAATGGLWPQWLHQQLVTNAAYRSRLAGHVDAYFFDGGLKVKSTVAAPPLTVALPVIAGSFSCQASIS